MKILNKLVLVLTVFFMINCSAQKEEKENWKTFSANFVKEYKAFEFPQLALDYVQNFEGIKSEKELLKQEKFFKRVKKELKKFQPEKLNESDKIDYELISYETKLNLERISLEKKWRKKNKTSISKDGLSTIPNGKKWYTYFLKRWIDAEVTPDEIYEFGLSEAKRVKAEMQKIQEKSGLSPEEFKKFLNDSSFFYINPDTIQNAFESKRSLIQNKMKNYFPYIDETPDFMIKPGDDKALAKVGGYYRNNTFYYNFFDKPYNKREVTWLFLHEAIPGHHYQLSYEKRENRSEVNRLFSYSWFIEGYAAYVEDLALEIDLYNSIYEVYGKYEWDIIRSVRVALDVGINYYHWSDAEALAFWQQYISDQDDIALREIERMKNWPVQVITYKFGANEILNQKQEAMKNKDFNLKEFHKQILKNGSLPVSILLKNK
ncbi:DUF885 domain-containing protein [Aureivirga marina]|uniref:DUF885 domain-containing protein n=1 Tax=Aureivirga marina TaxID=1182451 RepID=UPI0018CB51A2|nr:DUF885 domain-containing protein [Aureivirga marina]